MARIPDRELERLKTEVWGSPGETDTFLRCSLALQILRELSG